MTADIAQLWKQPTLANLIEGGRMFHGSSSLASHFAYTLFIMSDALPANASLDMLKLETARHVVRLNREFAERAFGATGFVTGWTNEQCEAIAREMAEAMPRHPVVVDLVERILERRRDEVFSDRSLTHGDGMFVVYQAKVAEFPNEHRKRLEESGVFAINEQVVHTLNRSLDYLSELRLTSDYRHFIPLHRVLTSLRRVYAVFHPA